ncbi:YhcH/YjgK/YiaL family protein [Bifidobacterium sp. ESL0784]|uniref:YhcH/YjgK/YiaL family protein n=1 Tax=Bifidobacterium sp. ESL0784 TaxID=2983231 RepID=UPI0023F81D8D|nr:YhcH/YjgK/YiaL family protein [Bifidobacterium sp. ESL0784]MDF7641027.1 YhcH/YjgK/YiaL family protein [Bifidobacterium sp. ESL0784]
MENGNALDYRVDPKVRARIDKAIAYLNAHAMELSGKADETYSLDGTDDIVVHLQSYDSMDYQTISYESHRDHIDLHYLLSGQEYVRWWDTGSVEPNTEYNADNDIVFYPHPDHHNRVLLTPGHYVLVYPEDMHAPRGMVGDTAEPVHKVVVKISVR